MWVQPSELSAAQTLISHGVGNPTFAILVQNGDLNWFADGAPEFGLAGAFAVGTTYHVVATYSSEQAVLYLDGESVGVQGNPAAVILDSGDPYFLGAFDGGLPFAGLIDDVQIYDRVLTADEVQGIFGTPGPGGVPGGIDPGIDVSGLTDVTSPDDPILLVDGNNDDDTDAGPPPGAEAPPVLKVHSP